jgi:hypothetical protein
MSKTKKSLEELKEEYDDLMEHYRASLKQKDYEAAEYFFNEAQKVGKEDAE